MNIQSNQMNQFNFFNSQFITNSCKASAATSLHSQRKMLAAQDEAKEAAAVKVTLSAEAMELSRKAREMERTQQTPSAEKTEEEIKLTDEEIYGELVNQVRFWGDSAYGIWNQYSHDETKEMAEKKAAALTQMQKLEELHQSDISKLEQDAQKAAAMASMQQEELNKKNSELIMMIESFKDQEEEDDKAAKGEDDQSGNEKEETVAAGNLMEGRIGASAVQKELQLLDTIGTMEQSGVDGLAANDQTIRQLLDTRERIYRMNDDSGVSINEKITEMSNYVGLMASQEELREYFDGRIDAESDEDTRDRLKAMKEYFMGLDTKNQVGNLAQDRAHAIQEKLNARDLRIAHLGDRHFAMAEQQEKELRSLFDENDILRQQGQSSVTSRTEEVAERLQEALDERNHVDEDTTPKKEVTEDEEQKKEEEKKEELEKEPIGDESQVFSITEEVKANQ